MWSGFSETSVSLMHAFNVTSKSVTSWQIGGGFLTKNKMSKPITMIIELSGVQFGLKSFV